MKYRNASGVLPDALIEQLQDFVQGEYLYIPARKGQREGWGARSGARREIDNRNWNIRHAHAAGCSVEQLSEEFHLSTHAIKKIIYQK